MYTNSLYFSRKEAHRKSIMFTEWSLDPYLQNCMQNIESSSYMNFLMEKCHIFHQIPKVFYGSKNVQILWLAHPGPGPGPTLGIISPLAHIPFLILENYLWFPKFTIAYTVLFFQLKLSFNFLSKDFPLIPQGPTDIQSLWRSLWHLLLLQGFWFPSGARYVDL